ncbi:hypothetical protein [Kroppenstedtia guangzhouensis]|jgi:hypothetical protein|nr:hypothetical protein [Kroppenstedtia guangzhouensis]
MKEWFSAEGAGQSVFLKEQVRCYTWAEEVEIRFRAGSSRERSLRIGCLPEHKTT